MGMFDHLHVSLEKLPVNEKEMAILKSAKDKGFQTKNFGCYLDMITIQDDGYLVGATMDDPYEAFDFYTLIGEHWIQFEASVREGRVYEIINVETGQKTSL